MSQISVSEHGGSDQLVFTAATLTPETVELKKGELLVHNAFAGINFIDTYFRSGLYKKPSMPYTPGVEGAGTVVKVGDEDADGRWLNRRVGYHGGSGSYASYTVVSTDLVVPLPEEVTEQEAAAVVCQGFTAHYLSHDSYPCKPGSVVVVHAAAGGTGLLLTQMAKLRGATVIGICGSEEKAALATTVGRCDHVINYRSEADWPAAVRRYAPDGVDAVFDGVGQSTFRGSLSVLRRHGYMISFGNASGAVPPVAPLELVNSVYLQRPKLDDYMTTEEEREGRAKEVFGWVARKEITLTIHHVLPLREAKKGHDLLEGQATLGKVLLDCRDA